MKTQRFDGFHKSKVEEAAIVLDTVNVAAL